MDISTSTDGYYVGWMRIDEYLRFTVDVTEYGMLHNSMTFRATYGAFENHKVTYVPLTNTFNT